ncbi:MAG: hypothetical protein QOJ99_673 [Bryobacterales bacterium]|nr:hypothetical protein [Bryobacterales bacterium]
MYSGALTCESDPRAARCGNSQSFGSSRSFGLLKFAAEVTDNLIDLAVRCCCARPDLTGCRTLWHLSGTGARCGKVFINGGCRFLR